MSYDLSLSFTCFVLIYGVYFFLFFFFFSSRRRHTRSLCDWSSDVCSSDLMAAEAIDGADEGIDRPRLEAWFTEHVPVARPPLEFERISGGRSNLTYEVRDRKSVV